MAGVTDRSISPRAAGDRTAGHPKKQPRIVQIAERLGRRIPASELRSLPKDLSNQLDHYIYGTPKR